MADFSIQSQTVNAPPLDRFNQIAKDLSQYFLLKRQMEKQEQQQKIDNSVKAIDTFAKLYKEGIGGPELLKAAEPHFKNLGFSPIDYSKLGQNVPENEVTSEMKNFEAQFPGMRAKRGTFEYSDAYSTHLHNLKPPTTKSMLGPDGKVHVFAWNYKTRKFDDDQGLSRDPMDIARVRAETFGTIPTSMPGVWFDRAQKKYFVNETSPDGTVQNKEISSEQFKTMSLLYKEETPTNDIRVMQQSAPSVLSLAKAVRNDIDRQVNALGPAASRWNEFWSGTVGAPNPAFRKLMTDVGLLTTRLMKMHVGARGGVEIMKHFENMINAGKQSPENMKEALSAIEEYAKETQESHVRGITSPTKQLDTKASKDPLGIR